MKYSHKIKEILKIKEITQTQLAFEFGVTFVALNRWINEVSKPVKKNQEKIDNIFDEISGKTNTENKEIEIYKKSILEKIESINIEKILQRPDFIKNLIIEMTYASNKIEGSTLTIEEVNNIIYENKSFSHRSATEHIEAKNHETAILFVLDNYKNKITENYILKLHSILMNSIMGDAGKYRTHNVRIVGSFVPTVNYLSIEKRMKEFLLLGNKKDIINSLAVNHSVFEVIHPFADGNGRVGRLLMLHLALQSKILPIIIKSDKRIEYLSALQKSQLENNFNNLEKVICDGLDYVYGFM